MSYSSFEEMAIANGWNEQQQHAELAASHYDLYKEVEGYKPRWINYEDYTIAELVGMIEELSSRETVEECRKREHEENIQMMFTCGAADRHTAERWARQTR